MPALALLVTVPVRADALADLKSALSRLAGRQPLAATIDVSRSRHAKGRFLTQDFDGTATIEADMTAEGVRIGLPRTAIDRANDEEAVTETTPGKAAPTAETLQEVVPQSVERVLNSAQPLLRTITRGAVAQERQEAMQGRPARALVIRLPKRSSGEHSVGSFTINEDVLTIRLDADGTPIWSRRMRKGSAGILFLRIEMTRTETTAYAVYGDHLVATRAEDAAVISGPGSQQGTARSVWTVRMLRP